MNISNNTMPSHHTQTPADLLKFIAYKKIASNFEEAIDLIVNKKLVLGEPIVVPFYYTHKSKKDASGNPLVTLELAFGIGSADVDHPYIHCSINNSISNEAIIDADGTTITLKEYLDNLVSKDDLENDLRDIISSEGFLDTITEEVLNSDIFEQKVNERVSVLADVLRWKSFDELNL